MMNIRSITALILTLLLLTGCSAAEPVSSVPAGTIIPTDPYAVDVGMYYGDFPDGIQPAIRVDGKNYYYAGTSLKHYGTEAPEATVYVKGDEETFLPDGYAEVGWISSVTTEALTEELQFRAGCDAAGEVYTSETTPNVVYIHLTAEWFDELKPQYYRFISEEMRYETIRYQGELYQISFGTDLCETLEELPEGCEEAGSLHFIGTDAMPKRDLETNCPSDGFSKALEGRKVYFDPDDPEYLYVYEHHYWAEGDYPTYRACPRMEQTQAKKSDQEQTEEILQHLSIYASDYHTIKKNFDIVIQDQGTDVLNMDLWEDFYTQVQATNPADITIAHFTTEGDPILTHIRYDGDSFLYVSDSSRDEFGAEPYYFSTRYPYLQMLKDEHTEQYILSDRQFESFEEYQAYCQTDPAQFPRVVLYYWPPTD